MSRAMGMLMRGRRRVVAMVAGVGLLIAGGTAVAVVLSRSPVQAPNAPCEIADNVIYAAVVDDILADYRAATTDPRFDAGLQVGNVAEYGFTPLFQMQACSVNEVDLAGVASDRGGMYFGLQQVIYDPEFHSNAWWATPIDVEVAWYAELGVEGLLGGWSTIARLDRDRVVGEIQRLLSIGLAHVTNPDRDAVLKAGVYPEFILDKERHLGYGYLYAFTELGGRSIELARYERLRWGYFLGEYLLDDPSEWTVADVGPRVYGWSVLAPLLRFGHFHEEFLTPVATAIVEFDRERGGDWVIEGEQPVSFDAFDDDPTSAMDAVLEALARNPDAAEAVYDATHDERVRTVLDDR